MRASPRSERFVFFICSDVLSGTSRPITRSRRGQILALRFQVDLLCYLSRP